MTGSVNDDRCSNPSSQLDSPSVISERCNHSTVVKKKGLNEHSVNETSNQENQLVTGPDKLVCSMKEKLLFSPSKKSEYLKLQEETFSYLKLQKVCKELKKPKEDNEHVTYFSKLRKTTQRKILQEKYAMNLNIQKKKKLNKLNIVSRKRRNSTRASKQNGSNFSKSEVTSTNKKQIIGLEVGVDSKLKNNICFENQIEDYVVQYSSDCPIKASSTAPKLLPTIDILNQVEKMVQENNLVMDHKDDCDLAHTGKQEIADESLNEVTEVKEQKPHSKPLGNCFWMKGLETTKIVGHFPYPMKQARIVIEDCCLSNKMGKTAMKQTYICSNKAVQVSDSSFQEELKTVPPNKKPRMQRKECASTMSADTGKKETKKGNNTAQVDTNTSLHKEPTKELQKEVDLQQSADQQTNTVETSKTQKENSCNKKKNKVASSSNSSFKRKSSKELPIQIELQETEQNTTTPIKKMENNCNNTTQVASLRNSRFNKNSCNELPTKIQPPKTTKKNSINKTIKMEKNDCNNETIQVAHNSSFNKKFSKELPTEIKLQKTTEQSTMDKTTIQAEENETEECVLTDLKKYVDSLEMILDQKTVMDKFTEHSTRSNYDGSTIKIVDSFSLNEESHSKLETQIDEKVIEVQKTTDVGGNVLFVLIKECIKKETDVEPSEYKMTKNGGIDVDLSAVMKKASEKSHSKDCKVSAPNDNSKHVMGEKLLSMKNQEQQRTYTKSNHLYRRFRSYMEFLHWKRKLEILTGTTFIMMYSNRRNNLKVGKRGKVTKFYYECTKNTLGKRRCQSSIRMAIVPPPANTKYHHETIVVRYFISAQCQHVHRLPSPTRLPNMTVEAICSTGGKAEQCSTSEEESPSGSKCNSNIMSPAKTSVSFGDKLWEEEKEKQEDATGENSMKEGMLTITSLLQDAVHSSTISHPEALNIIQVLLSLVDKVKKSTN